MSNAYPNCAGLREDLYKPPPPEELSSTESSPRSGSSRIGNVRTRPEDLIQPSQSIKITKVLEYMKRAFEDETTLDTLPLEAAGNSGAWKAWRSYRRSNETDGKLVELTPSLQNLDEWSWDGVWEERVRKGIDASIAESTLYGGTGVGDDLVSFLNSITLFDTALIPCLRSDLSTLAMMWLEQSKQQ